MNTISGTNLRNLSIFKATLLSSMLSSAYTIQFICIAPFFHQGIHSGTPRVPTQSPIQGLNGSQPAKFHQGWCTMCPGTYLQHLWKSTAAVSNFRADTSSNKCYFKASLLWFHNYRFGSHLLMGNGRFHYFKGESQPFYKHWGDVCNKSDRKALEK